MKKLLITVNKVSGGLGDISVGTRIELEKEPTNAYDPLAIKALVDGLQIGYVSSAPNTVATNCINSKEFYQSMISDKMEGVVIRHEQIIFKNNTKKTALVVEVTIGSVPKAKIVNKGGNVMNFKCKLKGATKPYPGKMDIMRDFQAGKTVYITLKKDGDTVIAVYGDKPAGIVDEKSSTDTTEFNEVVDVMAIMGDVTAKVTNVSASSYSIEFDFEEQTIKDAKSGKKIISLDDVKKGIIAQGICTEEEIDEIEKYMMANNLSRKQIVNVFSSYRKYELEVAGRIPSKPKTVFVDYFGGVKKSIIYLNKGKNLRYVGEKGTGKNNLITTLAWVYQRPLYEVSLNSQFDKIDLLGSKTISDTNEVSEIDEVQITEKGVLGWIKSLVTTIRTIANVFLKKSTAITFDKEAFVQAMETGGFINLDEVNTADPSVLVLLHSVTDDRRSIQVPGYGKVTADQNFGVILTMNKDYQGTVSLNEATRDRFVPIIFPSNVSIAEMLQAKVHNADADYIRFCDQLYVGILELIKEGELSMDCMTVRGFIDALEVADDLGLHEALNDNIANRIDDEDYRQKVLNMIDDVVG